MTIKINKRMKKYISVILLILVFVQFTNAQDKVADLKGINYQAVALNDEIHELVGVDAVLKPLYEKEIGVRFTITDGPTGSLTYFQESHVVTTDKYGMFSLTIGLGTYLGGDYDALIEIPWINGDQWLRVEIAKNNDGVYKDVNYEKFRTVPYSFYTDDIADNSITTYKIVNEAIIAEDINTGAVETSEILNETILAEDIATGAIETSEILNETILAEDIATGAIESSEILNGTIINEDVANATLDLTTKVSNVLPVANGGTGASSLSVNGLLIGSGSNAIESLGEALDGQIPIGVTGGKPVLGNITAGIGIVVTSTPGGIKIDNTVSGGVNSNANTAVNPGNILSGRGWQSPTFVLQQPANIAQIAMGDILIASADVDLQGCIMSVYLTDVNGSVAHARVSIFNPTNGAINLGNGVNIKILVVK